MARATLTASNNYGMSVLEVLVALVVVAAAVTAMATVARQPAGEDDLAKLVQFTDRFRIEAIASGNALVLNLDVGRIGTANGEVRFGPDIRLALSGADSGTPQTLVVYPDGSVSGHLVALDRQGGVRPLFTVARAGGSPP